MAVLNSHQHAGVQSGVNLDVGAASGSGAEVRQAIHLKNIPPQKRSQCQTEESYAGVQAEL